LKGTSKNCLFPRLRLQLRTRILMYVIYTAVLRAVLPCTHEKIRIFRGALKGLVYTQFLFKIMDISTTSSKISIGNDVMLQLDISLDAIDYDLR
jgi:hypothetical protein